MAVDAKLLAEKREALRYSQRKLAKAAGVPSSFISSIEAGKSLKPNYEDFVKVARVLGEDPNIFFGGLAQNFQQKAV